MKGYHPSQNTGTRLRSGSIFGVIAQIIVHMACAGYLLSINICAVCHHHTGRPCDHVYDAYPDHPGHHDLFAYP